MVSQAEQEARRALAGPPSREAFRALLRSFWSWPEGDAEARDATVTAAERVLATWPDELRQEDISGRFLFGASSRVQPWAQLVRYFEVYRADQNAYRFGRLMDSPYVASLTAIRVVDSSVDLVALAASPYLDSLTELSLVDQVTTEYESHALAKSPVIGRLRSLALIDSGPVATFLEGVSSMLTDLVLRGSLIRGNLAALLARKELLRGLATLDLSRNHLRDADAFAIIRAERLSSLQLLDMRDNPISRDGREALRRALVSTRLLLDP